MGYIAAVYTYNNWSQADEHLAATTNTINERPRTAYRGIVKQYSPTSPQVTIHNCPQVHYNKAKALADAKKLIIQLKKTVCNTPH